MREENRRFFERALRRKAVLIQNKEKERNAMKPIKEGKVREIYDNGDSLIMSRPTASAVSM